MNELKAFSISPDKKQGNSIWDENTSQNLTNVRQRKGAELPAVNIRESQKYPQLSISPDFYVCFILP